MGWLTWILPLGAAAWTGRLLCWALLAGCWRRLSFVAAPYPWLAVFSAGWLVLLVDQGHMAGEWLVGGVEAKCLAYPLVFLALAEAVRGRWSFTWPWLGAATMMHVLVGGWSLAGLLGVRAWMWMRGQRVGAGEFAAAGCGAFLALVGVWPALRLGQGVDPQLTAEAQWVYVYQRLPHHLVFHRFARSRTAAHLALWIVAVLAAWSLRCTDRIAFRRLTPVWLFAVFSGVLSVVGIAIDQLWINEPVWSAGWLRLYWFRLADVIVPAATSLLVAVQLGPLAGLRRRSPWVFALATALAMAAPVRTACQHLAIASTSIPLDSVSPDSVRRREHQWRDVCGWIRTQTPVTARFLTPPHQRSFKWWAQRPEVWTWKDIPQDPASVLAWSARRSDIMPRLQSSDPGTILDLMRRYQATYYVWDRAAYPWPTAPGLQRCYPSSLAPDTWFVVFQRSDGSAPTPPTHD